MYDEATPAARLRDWADEMLRGAHLARTDEPRDAIPAGAVLVWAEPLDTLRLEADLVKGLSHKYIKRVPYTRPDGRRSYRYWYALPGHQHLAHSEHLVEGAAFKVDGGHYHVTKVDGDIIHVRHDETGEDKQMSRGELARTLQEHHKDAIEQRYHRLAADHAQTEKIGTAAQRAETKAALDRHVEMYGRPGGGGGALQAEAKSGAGASADHLPGGRNTADAQALYASQAAAKLRRAGAGDGAKSGGAGGAAKVHESVRGKDAAQVARELSSRGITATMGDHPFDRGKLGGEHNGRQFQIDVGAGTVQSWRASPGGQMSDMQTRHGILGPGKHRQMAEELVSHGAKSGGDKK